MESSALEHLYAIEVQNSPTISYATVTFRNWIPAVRDSVGNSGNFEGGNMKIFGLRSPDILIRRQCPVASNCRCTEQGQGKASAGLSTE